MAGFAEPSAFVLNYKESYTAKKFHMDDSRVRCMLGPVGCLPCDTEVMTPNGWIRIANWNGQEILQWDSATRSCRFIKPRRFINAKCDRFLDFDCGKHFRMRVTANHRVPLYDWKGRFVVKDAAMVYDKPSKHTVPTTWNGSSDGIAMTDDEIRLWVAVCADGCYPQNSNQCVFALRKERKIDRIKYLLDGMGIEYKVSVYECVDGVKETDIRFDRPKFPKHFDWRLSNVNFRQANVFIDELKYWDGLYDSGHERFSGTNERDAEIVQYVSHCAGRNAVLTEHIDKRNSNWLKKFSVHIARIGSAKNSVQIRCDNLTKSIADSKDGKQYCFETDTGFFVVRQFGHVFITGNSGKSVACIVECALLRALKQEPDASGVRRTRGVMIRNTYNELKTTTIKTFKDWFGTAICTYVSGSPLAANVKIDLPDKTRVECEVLFVACDRPEDAEKLRSLEITWAYINEASEIVDYTILDVLSERIGRYPKQWRDENGNEVGGPTWSGIVMDSNAPDDEHWIYQKFEIEKPEGFKIFHQPPAVLLAEGATPENPRYEPNKGQRAGIPPAENVEHLGKRGKGWDYYMNQIPGKPYERIRVMLMGEYGTIAYGRPVYPEYKDQIYYLPNKIDPKTNKPKDVEVLWGIPLLLGFDFGLRYAACVFAQLSPMRQLRVIEEMVVQDISTREFASRFIMAKLHNEYHGMKVIAVGDPAGNQRKSTDATTDLTILNECGIPATACPTNSPKQRRESVVYFMQQLIEEEPGLVLGSKCPMLRKGFAGRYYYKKISTSSREDLYNAEPVKNEFSHPADALQYIATSLVIDPDTRTAATRATGAFSGFKTQQNDIVIPSQIDCSVLF